MENLRPRCNCMQDTLRSKEADKIRSGWGDLLTEASHGLKTRFSIPASESLKSSGSLNEVNIKTSGYIRTECFQVAYKEGVLSPCHGNQGEGGFTWLIFIKNNLLKTMEPATLYNNLHMTEYLQHDCPQLLFASIAKKSRTRRPSFLHFPQICSCTRPLKKGQIYNVKELWYVEMAKCVEPLLPYTPWLKVAPCVSKKVNIHKMKELLISVKESTIPPKLPTVSWQAKWWLYSINTKRYSTSGTWSQHWKITTIRWWRNKIMPNIVLCQQNIIWAPHSSFSFSFSSVWEKMVR